MDMYKKNPELNIIFEEVEKLKETLRVKYLNYGGNCFQPPHLQPLVPPSIALKVRLSDKIARLRNLENGEPDRCRESYSDTLQDLAGYAILLLAYDSISNYRLNPESLFQKEPEETANPEPGSSTSESGT